MRDAPPRQPGRFLLLQDKAESWSEMTCGGSSRAVLDAAAAQNSIWLEVLVSSLLGLYGTEAS